MIDGNKIYTNRELEKLGITPVLKDGGKYRELSLYECSDDVFVFEHVGDGLKLYLTFNNDPNGKIINVKGPEE